MLVAVLQSVAMTVANPLHNRLHHDRFRRVAANYDNHLAPRANPTDPWVTVDASGVPVTVTPVLTTISGTPTIISGAPAELTATVLTLTSLGDVRTTTLLPTSFPTANGDGRGDARGGNSGGNAGDGSGGGVALPTAGSSSGTGSFPVCKNKDGPGAPFCLPGDRRLVVGAVYYVTWDPTFFPSNTTVIVTGNFINATTKAVTTQAFSSPRLAAGWSFYAWDVTAALLANAPAGASAVNISLSMAALGAGWAEATIYPGPMVEVANPEPYRQPPAKVPTGPALYIALPTVLAFVVIMLFGTCLWNRKKRRIGLGNVMSRTRDGYGIGKSRVQRLGGRGRTTQRSAAVSLRDVPPQQVYRDVPDDNDGAHNGEKGKGVRTRSMLYFDTGAASRSGDRRDSDALGSLAGTPTSEHHRHHREDSYRAQQYAQQYGQQYGHEHPQSGGRSGNAFRDEMSRQERDRIARY